MHWRVKCAIQNIAGSTRIGAETYRYLASEILKTRGGEPRKWCFWFREHAVLIRRHLGRLPMRGTVWCIDPGVTHTSVLLLRLSADRVILSNKLGPLSPNYLDASVERIAADLSGIARALKIGMVEASHRLERAAREIADDRAGWLVHLGRDPQEAGDLQRGSVDTILSMGALEHYDSRQLGRLLPQMNGVLCEDGAMSHIIDLRDHFHHADANLHPLNHLRYSRRQWSLMTSSISFTNQMRRSDFIDLFESSDFEIVYSGYDPHGEYPPLGAEVHPEHRTEDPTDDEARVIHLVARKRSGGTP